MVCGNCESTLARSTHVKNADHVIAGIGRNWKIFHVWVDGIEITKNCYEACAGNPGYALCFKRDSSGNLTRCDCLGGINSERLIGNVEIRRRE